MTQVGEGRDARPGPPPDALGGPAVGEVLAERYRLEEHINDDSAGRQVWRGVDIVLRRPVAVVLRSPGGDSAEEMLSAAVAASRVVHPQPHRRLRRDRRGRAGLRGPGVGRRHRPARPGRRGARWTPAAPPPSRTRSPTRWPRCTPAGWRTATCTPARSWSADDGRVVLADARADSATSDDGDVRAIGGDRSTTCSPATGRMRRRAATALPDAPPRQHRQPGRARARSAPACRVPRRPGHGPARPEGGTAHRRRCSPAELARLDTGERTALRRLRHRCASPTRPPADPRRARRPRKARRRRGRARAGRWPGARGAGVHADAATRPRPAHRKPPRSTSAPPPPREPQRLNLTATRSASSTREGDRDELEPGAERSTAMPDAVEDQPTPSRTSARG